MDVLVVALELVLASKAVVAAVLAPEHGAWKLLLVGARAMLGLVVAFEVPKILGDGVTALLDTCVLSRLAVVAFLMVLDFRKVDVLCLAAWKMTPVSSILVPIVFSFLENSKAVDTSTILLCSRVTFEVGSWRPRLLSTRRGSTGFFAVPHGNRFRLSLLQHCGIRWTQISTVTGLISVEIVCSIADSN